MGRLDHFRATERETLKFRLLALLVVSVAVLLRASEVPVLPIVALLSAYLAYTALLRAVLIPRYSGYPLAGLMLAVDAASVLAAVHLIGPTTPAVILMPIAVVYFGLYLGYVTSLAMALVLSFGFVALAFASGRTTETANVIAVQVPSLFLLALLIGYLAQARLRESDERRVYQQAVQTEAQGKRLLEIAAAIGPQAWEGLGPDGLAAYLADLAGLPWVSLVRAETSGDGAAGARVIGASFPIWETASVPDAAMADIAAAVHGPPDGGAVEIGPADIARVLPGPLPQPDATPGRLWARLVAAEPLTVLLLMGPADAAGLDASTRRALDAAVPLVARVLEAKALFEQAERRGRHVVGALRSAVESAERLTEVRGRRTLQFGALSIEPRGERVRLGPTTVHLSRTEFDLLYALAANAGAVLNAETLLRELWGADYVPQGKPVDVTVHRLRRKLDAIPGGARLVRTVRGRGYTFAGPEALALRQETASAANNGRARRTPGPSV